MLNNKLIEIILNGKSVRIGNTKRTLSGMAEEQSTTPHDREYVGTNLPIFTTYHYTINFPSFI